MVVSSHKREGVLILDLHGDFPKSPEEQRVLRDEVDGAVAGYSGRSFFTCMMRAM